MLPPSESYPSRLPAKIRIEAAEDRDLLAIVRALDNADGHLAWHARVKLANGRLVFGPYGDQGDGTFFVANDWDAGEAHGFLPHEAGLRIAPSEVDWFEYVPESDPTFLDPLCEVRA